MKIKSKSSSDGYFPQDIILDSRSLHFLDHPDLIIELAKKLKPYDVTIQCSRLLDPIAPLLNYKKKQKS